MPNQLTADYVQPWITQKLARVYAGKRRAEDRTVHLHLFPLDSVYKLVSVFHTLSPTPSTTFSQCNAHCRQWTHTTMTKMPLQVLSYSRLRLPTSHCCQPKVKASVTSVSLARKLSCSFQFILATAFLNWLCCFSITFLFVCKKGVSSVFHYNYKWDRVILSSTSTTSGPNWSVHCFTVARMLRSRWSRASRWGSESTGEMGSCDIAVFKADFNAPFFR